MATDTIVLAAGFGVGRGDMALWQHTEQLRRTRQVVQLLQVGSIFATRGFCSRRIAHQIAPSETSLLRYQSALVSIARTFRVCK